jgi:hypothetical protein
MNNRCISKVLKMALVLWAAPWHGARVAARIKQQMYELRAELPAEFDRAGAVFLLLDGNLAS